MNQDSQEKRIRRLFRDLGRDDARKAPDFGCVLEAALLPGRGRGLRLGVWRFAALAAIPVLAIVVPLLLLRSQLAETAPRMDDFSSLDLRNPETTPPLMAPPIADPLSTRPIISTRGRRRHGPTRPARNSSLLISQWQSPTDYLLKVPGSELLKSIPRVPDSSPDITKSLIEKHN